LLVWIFVVVVVVGIIPPVGLFFLTMTHLDTHTNVDGVQFFLLPLVLGKSLLALLVSNTLYGISLAWYWYITHLGYRALPFLSQTEVFLFPIAAVALVYVLNLIGYPFGLGWNASRVMAHLYFD
jgi:hypothetical protein